MSNLLRRLWEDDRGAVISAELILARSGHNPPDPFVPGHSPAFLPTEPLAFSPLTQDSPVRARRRAAPATRTEATPGRHTDAAASRAPLERRPRRRHLRRTDP